MLQGLYGQVLNFQTYKTNMHKCRNINNKVFKYPKHVSSFGAWIDSSRFKFDISDLRSGCVTSSAILLWLNFYLFDRDRNAEKYFAKGVITNERTRRSGKLCRRLSWAVLRAWRRSPIILSTLKISSTISYTDHLSSFFLYFSFTSSSSITFPTIVRPTRRRRREGKGSSLIELFFFPCTLPRSPFIFKSPLRRRPSRLNGSFCFCFFRFIYAELLKNFTLTFMLGRNLWHGGWKFLRKLYGSY